jgi:hypothetical protein
MEKGKSFEISKKEVMEAFNLVKANRGAGGVDGVDIEQYEESLKGTIVVPSLAYGKNSGGIDGKSRMNREAHVRFRERLGVKLPGPTRRVSCSK